MKPSFEYDTATLFAELILNDKKIDLLFLVIIFDQYQKLTQGLSYEEALSKLNIIRICLNSKNIINHQNL